MQGLMLHCGANAVDYNVLSSLPTPQPKGARHVVRPFVEDADIIKHQISNVLNFNIKDEAYGVMYDKDEAPAKFFGLLEVEHEATEYSLTIGMRGSYDQTLSRSIAVGSRVFVCDNLAFSGEITIATKQTTFIARRIPQMIHDAVVQIPDMAQRQSKRFDSYHNTTISRERGDAALIEMLRRGALVPSQLGKAVAEWDEPSHEDHADGGYTLWRLHNAVTEAIKPANEDRALLPVAWNRTQPMTQYLDELV